MSSQGVKPFKVNIPEAELERLRQKLLTTRYPKQDVVIDAGDDYGFQNQWAVDMYDYWANSFSWAKAQESMNKWPQYTTKIEDLDIHFIHQPSSKPGAIPLLLVHGWPGSFYEFSEVIDEFSEGSENSPAFNCVVPSMPGFTYSSAPQRRGWTVKDTARVLHTLMLRLGYEEYCCQAGDWGSFPVRELGANPDYSKSCKAIHLNWCPGALPEDLNEDQLTEREKKARDKAIDWRTNHIGYAVLMRTRPHSLGWMLQDNPLGLLAFVGEKYQEASNPSVQGTSKWKDHVLTTVCLYYFTDCIMSSALVYYENAAHHNFASYVIAEENKIKCPMSYTSYIYDTSPNSKRAVERTGNLVMYQERDYAGHFACLEDPDGVAEDTRELVSKFWSR